MTTLRWYANRLRSMSLPEIAHRIEEKRRKIAARRWPAGWDRFVPPEDAGEPLPVLPGMRQAMLASPRAFRAAAAEASAGILSGRYSALGVEWPRRRYDTLFPPGIWRLDPVTGGSWPGPDRYTFDIPYRHERVLGDIKYVWEFNRLQFLQPLAVDVLCNGNAAALPAIEAAIASWWRENPPFRGIAWNSGIELALRAISLLVVASLCGERLRPESRRQLSAMLRAHALWIGRYPSRFSSANNHRVAELAAEFLLSVSFGKEPGTEARCRRAAADLAEEASRQIFVDGVGAEQSPTYAAFTAEFLLLSAIVGEKAGRPLPDVVAARLEAFVDHVRWLADEDGAVPAIGDDDEGRVICLSSRDPRYVASVAAAIAAWRGVPAPAPVRPEFRTALAGSAWPAASPAGIRTFAEGGYTIIRRSDGARRMKLVFDHGPLGYLSIAAHGHADALSVCLSVDGRPVLVDPGTYLYHSGDHWRDWFRGTAAHNTLLVAEADQSVISGPFNWSHKAAARLEAVRGGDDWRLAAAQDGYRGRFGVIHRREVASAPGGFTIRDTLEGPGGSHPCSLSFQLAEGLEARLCEDMVELYDADGTPLATMTLPDASVSVALGEEGAGWVSPAFGMLRPAPRIVWRGTVGEEGRVTRIVLR